MTTTKESSGPAFPAQEMSRSDGMTLRAYAAIALRQPTSGVDWLDEMIRASMRGELAAKVMQGMCTHPETWSLPAHGVASQAYALADLMLKAGT